MPRYCLLRSLPIAPLILALTLLLPPTPLVAQAVAANDPGKECADPPTFAFSRIENDIYELLVTSEKEKRAYEVQVDYLCRTVSCPAAPTVSGVGPDAPCWSSSSPKPATVAGAVPLFCAVASPSITRVPIHLNHAALLESGGLMRVTYSAIAPSLEADCQWSDTGVVPVRALQKHVLNIDLGSVFNLSGDGGWKPSAEVALFSRSEWHPIFVGGFDVRYSAVETTESGNAEEEGEDGDDGDGGDGGEGAAAEEAEEEAKEPKEFNPFEQKGGVFEATAYGVVRPPGLNWLGLAGGLGFASVPGDDSGDALDVRQRYWVAIETSVQGYNAGEPANRLGNTTGFLRFGWMKDDRWEKTVLVPATETEEAVTSDESDRYFVEGEIELPRIGTDALRFAIRLFASIPKSGDGASDVRISALATVDPRKWFGGGDNGGSK